MYSIRIRQIATGVAQDTFRYLMLERRLPYPAAVAPRILSFATISAVTSGVSHNIAPNLHAASSRDVLIFIHAAMKCGAYDPISEGLGEPFGCSITVKRTKFFTNSLAISLL